MIITFQTIAILNLVFLYFKDKDILKIDMNAVYRFMGFMSLITLLRLVVMDGQVLTTNIHHNPVSFLFVGLEDLAFGGTLYIFEKFVSSEKRFLYPMILLVSLAFGYGHLAYSIPWAIAMCYIPWFVFVRFGKKYGIFSTIVMHMAFDILTYFTFKLAVVLNMVRI